MAPHLATQILGLLSGHGPLRRQLARLLATLSIGLLIAVNLAWLPGAIEEARTSQADLQRIAARGARDQIRHFVEDMRQHLTAGSMLLRQPYFEHDEAELHLLTQRFLFQHPAFTEIGCLDSGARETFRLSRTQSFTKQDLRDRSDDLLFWAALESGTAWGPVVTAATAVPSVSLATRLRRSQRGSLAVVTGVINLQALWELTGDSNLKNGGRVYVVDQQGRLIAADDPNLVLKQLVFAERSLIQDLIRSNAANLDTPTVGVYTNENGVRVRATGLAIPGPGWSVVVEQPESVLYAPMRRTFFFTVSVILGGVAVSLWLAPLMSRHFTGPITQLREEVQRFGEGHLERRVTIETGGEIGELAIQFNQMAEALASSYQGLEDKVADRTRALAALFDTARHAVSARDLNEVFSIITRSATELVTCHASSIRLLDRQTSTLVVVADSNPEEGFKQRGPLRLGQGCAGQVALQGRPMVVEDIDVDGRYYHRADALRARIRSIALVPLRAHEDIIGVLNVYDTRPRPFSEAEVSSLTEFAHLASLAIEKARLHEATQRELIERRQAEAALAVRTQQLEAIRAVGTEITRELELTAVLRLIHARALELAQGESGVLFLWDVEAQALIPRSWHGFGDWVADVRLRMGEGVTGHVAAQREGMFVNDIRSSPHTARVFLERASHVAVLAEPLLYRDRLVGVIAVNRNDSHRPFVAEDQRLVRLFAAQAAIAIENARLYQAAARRGAELEALLRATRSVMSGLDLEDILDRILAEAAEIAGTPHVRVMLLDRKAGLFRVARVTGGLAPQGSEYPLESLSGLVISSGQPVFSPNVAGDTRSHFGARYQELGIVTFLGLPITSGEKVLGVLAFNTTEARKYTPEEVSYLAAFADQAAIAIEKARLFDEQQRAFADLQRAQDELVRSQKLRGLGQMAAGIAHDLNNMLAAILGQVELLKLRGAPPQVCEGLRTVEMAAADGAEVVRRLQDFARQRATSPLAPMDLRAAVQEAVEITRPRWQDEPQRSGRVIAMRTHVDDLPPILGHAPEIREALTNLIFNAVDAMPAGGTLTVTGSALPDGVTLTLADTGTGMSDDVRQKIFEPFFTTKGVKGTGLGLSVVYGILVRHGGEISVASTPGRGTTITLRFQAAAAPTESVPPTVASVPPAPRRLLLIDDEATVRTTLANLLRAAGHSVVEAASGAAGFAALATHPVDLVVTDLGMPEMTGWEVARTVKARHPSVPVVLLTGWGEHATGDGLERAGVDRVLGKPIKVEHLLRTIAECCELSAQNG